LDVVSDILTQLRNLQVNTDAQYYLPGIFPSQRFHTALPYKREDQNIFFSAAITYTLQEYKCFLPEQQRKLIDTISEEVVKNYEFFQNTKGLRIYNFFKTKPTHDHFPNGVFFNKFRRFKLAEDADDTAYVYLTNPHSVKQAQWLKNKLMLHANGVGGKFIRHTFKELKKNQAYSVYFGEKMLIEFDLCVLTNVLLFNHFYDLPTEKNDVDVIRYLTTVIDKDLHISHPHIVSTCYPTFGQIVYHMTRAIATTKIPELVALSAKLIDDMVAQIVSTTCHMEKMMILISLHRLKFDDAAKLSLYAQELRMEDIKSASFFYTSPLLTRNSFVLRDLLRYDFFKFFSFRAKCEAYNLALIFEYEMIQLISKTNDKN
jgi:hypothetical protein